jgi:hypothetical protein
MKNFKEKYKKYLGVLLVSLAVSCTIIGCTQKSEMAGMKEDSNVELTAGAERIME